MYLRIVPTDDRLAPSTLTDHVRRLHGLHRQPDRWWRRWFADDPAPIEWLIVATGTDERSVEYYAGTPDEDVGGQLERILRGLFPNSYELETADRPSLVATDAAATDTDADDADDGADDDAPASRTPTGAVEFRGRARTRQDWQTRLTPIEHYYGDDHARVPLATVVEAMADREVPMVYQALLRPYRDWSGARDARIEMLEAHQDTIRDKLLTAAGGAPDDDVSIPRADEQRKDELEARDPRQSFVVNARLVTLARDDRDDRDDQSSRAGTTTASRVVNDVTTTFEDVGGVTHHVDATVHTGGDAAAVYEAVRNRTVHPPAYERPGTWIPVVANTSRGIVADPTEASVFCLLDGAALTTASERTLATTPDDRTAIPRPPDEQLTTYQSEGLAIGRPRTQDDEPAATPVAVPPSLQPLHCVWLGKTGSGKTTALLNAIRDNHGTTDGPDILVDRKGDGMAHEYLRAHYLEYGSLENVYYFDCTETLPALSFFDVRDQLAVGIDRPTAVEDVVEHYVEMLKAVMGPERYERAVRSPDVIRYLVKAMFDPVHGADAFAHRDLQETARRMAETRDAPTVSDPELERMLGGVAANSKRSFDELMQGVANRIEKIPMHDRLARIFNHVHDEPGTGFDFLDVLDEDAVVVVDVGGLRAESQRVLTLVLLSNLWTALQRRARTTATADTHTAAATADGTADTHIPAGTDPTAADTHIAPGTDPTAADTHTHTEGESTGDADAHVATDAPVSSTTAPDPETPTTDDDLPLVNLYLEEAADVAASDLVGDLLAKSRSFGLSVTLAMQFPGQLRERDREAYAELLNNVSTVVTGNVGVDRDLTRRLATEDMTPEAVGNRLRSLSRGEWLVSLPAPFNEEKPRPFLLESLSLPPGHPDGDQPLDAGQRALVDAAITRAEARTREQAGIAATRPPRTGDRQDAATDEETDADDPADAEDPADADDATEAIFGGESRVATTLPLTKRLPSCLEYDAEARVLACSQCGTTHPPSLAGLTRAINCCHSLDDVHRRNIPTVTVDLMLSADERADRDYTTRQLTFLQVVVNTVRGEYDPDLEFDLLHDSMNRLQEYVGLDDDAIQELLDDDLLRHDGDHPKRLYSVTDEGRALIDDTAREGIDHGEGAGDLGESSQHVLGVELADRVVTRAYETHPESAVERVEPYYELEDGRRLDLVGLDAEGEVVVAVEVERINHDVATAVPEDHDKMAACDPAEAIWIVMTQSAGHRVLEALNDPPDGDPRIEKTYSPTTPPHQFRVDAPGCSGIYPVTYLRDRLDDLPIGPE